MCVFYMECAWRRVISKGICIISSLILKGCRDSISNIRYKTRTYRCKGQYVRLVHYS